MKVNGETHSDTANILFWIGQEYHNLRNHREGLKYFEQALSKNVYFMDLG